MFRAPGGYVRYVGYVEINTRVLISNSYTCRDLWLRSSTLILGCGEKRVASDFNIFDNRAVEMW